MATETSSAPLNVEVTNEVIGKGGFGVVRRGVLNGDAIAVKEIDLAKLKARDATSEETLMREVAVSAGLEHPNVLKTYGWRKDENKHVYMYLELLRGPELQQVLDARGAFSESEVKVITRQIVDALNYLHHRKIVHRDVKAENVMLTEPLADKKAALDGCTVKLLDFGLARQLGVKRQPRASVLQGGGGGGSRRGSIFDRVLGKASSALGASKLASSTSATNRTSVVHVVPPPALPKAESSYIAESSTIELSCVGTKGYAPPQLTGAGPGATKVNVGDFDHAVLVDAFAVGKLLRYMLCGIEPEQSVMEAVEGAGCLAQLGCGGRRGIEPQQLSPPARDLMERLSKKDAAERMALIEARGHDWLAEA